MLHEAAAALRRAAGGRHGFDVQGVTDALRETAEALLADLRRQADAPRMRDALTRLRDAAHTARRLHRTLKALDGISGGALHAAGGHVGTADEALALARAAEAAADRIETEAPASAGNRNLAERLFGDPRDALARRCAELVIRHAGAAACTATVGGAVHVLAASVWIYATGLDAEEAALERRVKEAAPAARNAAGLERPRCGTAPAVALTSRASSHISAA